jgi:uncharacterized protein
MSKPQSRLEVVDALRGFAIVSIMLVHNLEHFEFYFKPAGLPAWLVSLDSQIWNTVFFLFGGKSYAIFALLFGLTFAIQDENQARKGADFRPRFAWRLVLLFGFGLLNSMLYQGDILLIYALLGFVLLPVARLRTGVVACIAALLLLQPYLLFEMIQGLLYPVAKLPNPASWAYFGKSAEYMSKTALLPEWWGNLTNGRTAVFLWCWEVGRVFQTCALFMFGMLAGRLALFSDKALAGSLWKRILGVAGLAFVALYFSAGAIKGLFAAESAYRPLMSAWGSLSNFAFMLVLVAGFVLLYRIGACRRVQSWLAPIGRMSLSNYVIQSIIGTTLYHGYGFGLYKYTGATVCLFIGLSLAVLQGLFSAWWFRSHSQGPLEALWHRWTWFGRKETGVPKPLTQEQQENVASPR